MRRMMPEEMIIKSQVADDKSQVDLNEILEKYGTVTDDGSKTITLQIYNKFASEENQNSLTNKSNSLGSVVINGSITITKHPQDSAFIQGMLLDENNLHIPYLEIEDQNYQDGIILTNPEEFDLYVIRV